VAVGKRKDAPIRAWLRRDTNFVESVQTKKVQPDGEEKGKSMKKRNFTVCTIAALVVLPTLSVFAQQRIQVLEVFNFPAGGVSTLPQKINDNGDIAGVIDSFSGIRRGFVRFRNGHFTPSIVDPNDTAGFTDLRGINNSREVDGAYIGADGLYTGFLATGNNFTDYNAPDSTNTILLDLNDAGDLCGGLATEADTNFSAFIDVGGTVTTIEIPDRVTSFAYGINNSDEVVGQYTDSSGASHAFFRDASGNVQAPVDPPGSTAAILFGLNDTGYWVGRFTDAASGLEKGYVQTPNGDILVLDNPNASLTSLNGINNNNLMCGRSVDLNGVAHGIVAKIGNQAATPVVKERANTVTARPQHPQSALGLAE
jgi:hypothetical protein